MFGVLLFSASATVDLAAGAAGTDARSGKFSEFRKYRAGISYMLQTRAKLMHVPTTLTASVELMQAFNAASFTADGGDPYHAFVSDRGLRRWAILLDSASDAYTAS